MAEKLKAPLYNAGEVYYLSHKTGSPAKIYIEAVYRKAQSKEWMYSVFSEANDCKQTYLPESVLKERISRHKTPVYNEPEIAKRWEDGYRFCGNYPTEEAINVGKKFACNASIASVVLHPAVDAMGKPVDAEHGVWIKWRATIGNKVGDTSSIVIK